MGLSKAIIKIATRDNSGNQLAEVYTGVAAAGKINIFKFLVVGVNFEVGFYHQVVLLGTDFSVVFNFSFLLQTFII